MKNRIFWSILLISVLLLTVAGLILLFTMYHSFTDENVAEIRTEAQYLLTGYEQGGMEYIKAAAKQGTNRVTLITEAGEVIYDSQVSIVGMENHINRTEILGAKENGSGSDIRDSASSGDRTYYFALKASDENILRVAATMDALTKVLSKSVTLFLILLAASIFIVIIISSRITRAIIKPINSIDPKRPIETGTYDELNPLLVRMDMQNKKIREQFAALERAKLEFEEITNQMTEALIVFSYNKKVLSANKSAIELFNSKEIEGKHYSELSDDEHYINAIVSAFEGKAANSKIRLGERIFRINVNPVKAENGTAAVLFGEDITTNELAEQMRREFSANVSHELKTPLTSIMGAAEIMQAGIAPPEDHGRFIAQIYKESKRLLDLIEDIIGLSRLDEGISNGEFAECNLKTVAEKVIAELSQKAKNNGITLILNASDVYVNGIEISLHEIIYNLCDNAIKYNNPGGFVEIGVTKTSSPLLYVRDNGIGIVKEDHARIFERFYRVDKSRSKQSGGTGLGLSIVKHAAILHKAELSIESEIGKGTTISVEFKNITEHVAF